MPRIIEVVYFGGLNFDLDEDLRKAIDPKSKRPSGSGFCFGDYSRDISWDLTPKDDEKKLLKIARSIVRKYLKKGYSVKIRSY